MTEIINYNTPEVHKFHGIESNMRVWELLGKESLTSAEKQEMMHAAHASLFHWNKVGTAVNETRGEWMISHVYAFLRWSQPAMYHAERCLKICVDNNIGDFDLAYAYESMARALASNEDPEEAKKYLDLAGKASDIIADPENKKLFIADFEAGPWYGVK